MSLPNARVPIERLVVVPRRQYGLWIGTALALLVLFLVVKALATNPAFGWSIAGGYLFHPSILRGLGQTLIDQLADAEAALEEETQELRRAEMLAEKEGGSPALMISQGMAAQGIR